MAVIETTSVEIVEWGPSHLRQVKTSPDFGALLQRFLVRYSGRTRTTYAECLRLWFRWCSAQGLDPLEAETIHVELYLRWMEEERENRPGTIAHRLSVMSQFYQWAEDEEIITRAPTRKVRKPKVPQDSRTVYVDRLDMAKVMAAAAYDRNYHAMVALMSFEGLRVSEVCSAKIEELSFGNGHRVLTVKRKGGKIHTFPIPPKLGRIIDAAVGERTTGPIVLATRTGGPMTRHNAYKAVRRIGKKAGLPYPLHPHALRHGFVTAALEAGMPLQDVQDSAGHSDPRTTQRYNRTRGALDRHVSYTVVSYIGGA